MQEKILTMSLLKEEYGVCRLENDDSIPAWAIKGNFFSITKTSDELSIVCLQENIPNDIKCEKDWRVLKVEGPLDFSLVGILSSISSVLALKKISIFAISTYDTDYILVKETFLEKAVLSLREAGYNVVV